MPHFSPPSLSFQTSHMGSRLKNRANFRLCFTDEAKHRKRCYQCSGSFLSQRSTWTICTVWFSSHWTEQNHAILLHAGVIRGNLTKRTGILQTQFFSWVSISHHSSISLHTAELKLCLKSYFGKLRQAIFTCISILCWEVQKKFLEIYIFYFWPWTNALRCNALNAGACNG